MGQNRGKLKFRIDGLKRSLRADRYSMVDFWLSTSLDISLLTQKSRKREIIVIRQVGCVWAVLSGLNLTEAGKIFNQDHATVLHSMSNIETSLELPNSFPEHYELLQNLCHISSIKGIETISHSEIHMLKFMDSIVSPLLQIHEPTEKVAVNMIHNQIKQTRIAV